MNVERSADIVVGGTVNFDTAAMEEVSYAFDPESLEEESEFAKFLSFAQIPNCIIMSYSNYMEMLEGTPAISLNGVHMKIDHSQLSSDTDTIYGQLNQITTRIEVYGTVDLPNILVVDLLELALDAVADQLDQMRLFLKA